MHRLPPSDWQVGLALLPDDKPLGKELLKLAIESSAPWTNLAA
jgi:hypothetical protein